MPITVRYLNDAAQECSIRPTPLISIASQIIKTPNGDFLGVTYNITLTGTILDDQGFPLARDTNGGVFPYHSGPVGGLAGPYLSFDTSVSHADYGRPPQQKVPWNYKLDAIFFKQKVLRELFGRDGQRVEISPVHNDEPAIVCYPRVMEISFSEGNYVQRSDYTITLQADTLLDKDSLIDQDGNPRNDLFSTSVDTEAVLAASGAFIESYTESWSLEADEGGGETTSDGDVIPRTYRISHSMNAVGKSHYAPDSATGGVKKYEAWEQARKFVHERLIQPDNGVLSYPSIPGLLGSGTINLIESYRGFNHVRTEEVGASDGSYTVSENWVLASGTAHETYSMSISSDLSNPFVSVTIDGSIKGLSECAPSGEEYGGTAPTLPGTTAYDNALAKYHAITQSGKFGLTSDIYNRANNQVAVALNSQPTTVSLSTNEYTGDITYNLAFNNRPTNVISGVLSENISVNDTYPGDVFAMIPVIGRKTGPILQYIGGRTEYKRDLSIELVMDYTDIGYEGSRKSLMLHKPSLVEPTKTQIKTLIKEISPEQEPGIRKYFISPPTESWTPKEGRYNFSISWTYELDK